MIFDEKLQSLIGGENLASALIRKTILVLVAIIILVKFDYVIHNSSAFSTMLQTMGWAYSIFQIVAFIMLILSLLSFSPDDTEASATIISTTLELTVFYIIIGPIVKVASNTIQATGDTTISGLFEIVTAVLPLLPIILELSLLSQVQKLSVVKSLLGEVQSGNKGLM